MPLRFDCEVEVEREGAKLAPSFFAGDDGSYEARRGSAQAVGAWGEEFEEVQVSEDLELLADFVGDMGVLGMELG